MIKRWMRRTLESMGFVPIEVINQPRIAQHAGVSLSATLTLTEPELAALEALAGYGDDAFLRNFYQLLGRTYLEPHEKGVRTLFRTVREHIPGLLSRAKKAREAFRS